ncbi:M15 family metallopeptidase [Euzebya tangerina]|uniref:M15 family metallopeptidase n=1 Tax=Euzebya tangerina TaxID=591198 RepID=UPI000E324E00|nr:M15 family metallopeptidase [Euzebya tangerina]
MPRVVVGVLSTVLVALLLPLPSIPAAAIVLAAGVDGESAPGQRNPARRGPEVSVIRTTGSLPADVVVQAANVVGVTAVAEVDTETVRLMDTSAGVGWASGFGVAFDLYGVDPATYADVVPAAGALDQLGDGEVVLSATAARQRGIGPGDWIALHDGRRLAVVGTIAAGLIDGAGGVVTRGTLQGRTRYALVAHGVSDGVPAALDAIVAPIPRTLVRTVGAAPWSIGWRTVASLTALEDALGPLPYRPAAGRSIVLGQAVDVVDAEVPILGRVRCHAAIIEPLRQALGAIEQDGLADLVDPTDYAGCHSPRLIAAGGPISRHAFGIAVDLNASTNGFGVAPTMDLRIVEHFSAAGFVWGGDWPVPDGMHFEWHPDA